MKKQAVMAFALTIVASYYFSEIIFQSAQADFEVARASGVVITELSE